MPGSNRNSSNRNSLDRSQRTHRDAFKRPNEILTAARELGFSQTRLRLVGSERYEEILSRICERFTHGGKRNVRDRLWWWEDYRGKREQARTEENLAFLRELFPPDEHVWLVVEDSEKKAGAHWLFEADFGAAIDTLENSPFMEFYLVDRAMRWMISENHHGVVTALGELAIERLRAKPG